MPYIYGKSWHFVKEEAQQLNMKFFCFQFCRFQTSKSGRLLLHTDIRMLISRRTDCDTAAAHAKGTLESPNELKIVTVVPEHPKFSTRLDIKV